MTQTSRLYLDYRLRYDHFSIVQGVGGTGQDGMGQAILPEMPNNIGHSRLC